MKKILRTILPFPVYLVGMMMIFTSDILYFVGEGLDRLGSAIQGFDPFDFRRRD